ncbi:MAG TPA: amino acid adenylation domain-containing protein [Marinagarivorans sp.]
MMSTSSTASPKVAENAELVLSKPDLKKPQSHTHKPSQQAPQSCYPLSEAQMGIWLGQQLMPNSPHYNTAELIEFSSVEPKRLINAIKIVLANCAPLNTRFISIDGQAKQRLEPTTAQATPIEYCDFSAEDSPLAFAKAWADKKLNTVMALDKEPPYHSAIIKLGEAHYAWLLMIHHIACDGFAYAILTQQVAALYREPEQCYTMPWSDSLKGYQQLLTADKDYQHSPACQQDKDYWLSALAKTPAPLSLSAEPTQALNFNKRSLRVSRTLSKHWLAEFQALCKHNSTQARPCHWAHGVNALVAMLIFQYTGAQHITLGQPVMNRMGSSALKIPAMVMNIVPLPISLQGIKCFNDLLKAVCQQNIESKKHNRYRYEDLNRTLKTQQNPKRAFGPVVNVMPFDRAPNFSDARVDIHPLSAGPVEDIAFSFALTRTGELHFLLEGNPTRYHTAQLDHYADTLLSLADNLIDQRGNSLLTVNKNLTSWLRGPQLDKTAQVENTVLGALYTAIKSQPEKTALEYVADQNATNTVVDDESEWQTISYAQLAIYSVDCAQTLAQQSVRAGDCVVVALPRGPWSVVIAYACLTLDAHFIFIDPTGPQARNLTIINDAKPVVVILDTQHAHSSSLSAAIDNARTPANTFPKTAATQTRARESRRTTKVLALESLQQFAKHSKINATAFLAHKLAQAKKQTSPLAYGIYTSGSTGQPKGVMVDQHSLNQFVLSANQVYQVTSADRVLHFAPMHFDTCIEEIFITLCAGGTLVVRNDDMINSMAHFNRVCQDRAITVLDLPTAFWHEWVFYCAQAEATLPKPLHTVIIGGEAALAERVNSFQTLRSTNPVRLLNTYGPSEATVVASCAELGHSHSQQRGNPFQQNTSIQNTQKISVSIGQPLPNRTLLILRESEGQAGRGQAKQALLAQRGEAGELVIAGESLAQGYLNNPAQTHASFTSLAFGGIEPTIRIYRTGDRARINSDGNIEYLGRLDNEIKMSGQRINPAEIESVLLRLSEAAEVAVIVAVAGDSKRAPAAPQIVAYIGDPSIENTTTKGYLKPQKQALKIQTLREALQHNLPAVMIPQHFIYCARLPKTPSGKVDKKALLQDYKAQQSAQNPTDNTGKTGTPTSASNVTTLESTIITIWQAVLGGALHGKAIAPSDDFFVLGGQSLQLLQIATRLSTQLRCEVPVTLLFQHPTAQSLAMALAPLSSTPLAASTHNSNEAKLVVMDNQHHLTALRLPDDFPAASRPASAPGDTPGIFLTGATGFVGIQLLHHLLASTTATIHCLVRAQSQQHAWEKIRRASLEQTLPAVVKHPRIRLVLGSIEQPRFGLSEPAFAALTQITHTIIHNAAITSIVRSYASLEAANVNASLDCLRLAALSGASIHYVSTIAVGGSSQLPEAFIPWHKGLHDGYQQTKWASESLIQQASERGVKAFIYRLPRVVGEKRTGFINGKDLVWKIIAASSRTQALPSVEIREPWLSVDCAANTICQNIVMANKKNHPSVSLGRESQACVDVINCVPMLSTCLNTLFKQLAPRFNDRQISMPDWLRRLSKSEHAEDQALLAFFQSAPKAPALPVISNDNFYQLLQHSNNKSNQPSSHQTRADYPATVDYQTIDFAPYIESAEQQGLLAAQADTRPKNKRTPPRMLEVQSCSNPHPQIRRIILSGESLRGFPVNHYGGHIKVFLPRAHQQEPVLPTLGPKGPIWPPADERPITRTYSVRYYNPVNNTLAVDFVMHKNPGPAANWAQNAKPGDRIGIAGPGGPDPLLAPAKHHIIAGDLTSLPAIEATLESLPSTAQGCVFIAADAHGAELKHNTQLCVIWLSSANLPQASHLDETSVAKRTALQLLNAVKDYLDQNDLPRRTEKSLPNDPKTSAQDNTGLADLSALVAGENSLVLAVRDYLRSEFKLPKTLLYAVPYWRRGQDEEGYHQQRHTIMDEAY